jgi:hypothetical protein
MATYRYSTLLVAGAIGVGLALTYCGGTVESDESALGTTDMESTGATQPVDAGILAIPGRPGPAVAAPVSSFRVHEPQVVAQPPPEPAPPPCPGCPPEPGLQPARPSPIDTPY